MSINRLTLEVREEDFGEILETLIEKYDNIYSLTILGDIFDELEYFERFLPHLKKSIQKNGIESEFLISYLGRLSRLEIPISKKWERAQIYLEYILDFAPPAITNFPSDFILDLSNELEILSTFIDKYPQVLVNDFPYLDLTNFTRKGNAKNFFQVARSRGIDCSIQIYNLASRLISEARYACVHNQKISELICFVISEKFFVDIYHFEEDSKFFINFVKYLMQVHYESIEKEIEFLFPTIVDLGKIYGQDTNYEKRIWNSIGELISRLLLVEELPQINKIMDRKFTPTVWNVDLLIYLLEEDALHPQVISNIYELIRYSETESLDQYVHRLLSEEKNSSVVQEPIIDNISFANFTKSDPKFYICLYNACQLRFNHNV
ncbi:predicted protein [Naegleria gruberi]|uniref:Predicted protein n=1 Tax=Naegleria gruberi TaxID=5762 RepID=D2W678_NAEGR|nr:uncharacterized protein NAEGRDRAFT_76921 [Naegleria gruberi]EFC35423.1 predicted protein [Naegleria gruberi]|eukprot:XP_002668167.1 predicted protein [Naegleria gruberi strain NEG-M]